MQSFKETKKDFEMKYKNCMDCPAHKVKSDPDPFDSFCSDDEKVVCGHTGKNITVACRPHHKRNECTVPSWCPLRKNP